MRVDPSALVSALRGHAHRLDAYAAERRPIACEIVAFTDRLTRLATAPRSQRFVRNFALSMLAIIPAVRRRLAFRLAGLVYRAPVADGPSRLLPHTT